MKKLILIFTLAASSLTQAQDSDDVREKFIFGLKAGFNYANVYDTKGEEFDTKGKAGLAAGLFFAIPIGKYVGIHPEVLFSQKGFRANGRILGSSYDFKRTSNYIDVPLFLAVKPIGFLTLLAGPQYSFLVQQKSVFTSAIITTQQQEDFDNDNIRKNTLCFVAGFDVNIQHVVLGARAGWDLQNNNGDGTSTNPRYKNAWFQGTIGYRFY